MDPNVATLKSKQKKKYPAGNLTNYPSKKNKLLGVSDKSKNVFKKKKSVVNKNIKYEANISTDFQNPNKSVNISTAKKIKKKKTNTTGNTDHKSQRSQSLIQSEHKQKSKKKGKFKSKGNVKDLSSEVASVSPEKRAAKLKKGKKKSGKLTSKLEENEICESDDELSEFCISDDEADEEVLREEIQNSLIFKKIEKLMKKAPHLNPANPTATEGSNDDVQDNSSDWSIEMDDESAEETDDQDSVSSESDLEDSSLKNKTKSKLNVQAKGKEKNAPISNKKSNFNENVIESAGFNRTSKDVALTRNIHDKNKKGEMSSNLKSKVQEKLAGAKFRFLNEKLYTETGKEAFKYFQENTEEFDDYHSGYRLQVSKWPINPVNEIIADIQKLKKSFVIADLGCGEAKIAQTFPDRTIHSFDLVPLNKFVKACDISKIPLPNESVDVVVFCLSLMGTNLKDYLCEAFRILKGGGILKIAEVESRIEDLGHFIGYLKSIGFALGRKNTKHKMFVFLDLKKEKQKCKLCKVPSLTLRPCLYKKR